MDGQIVLGVANFTATAALAAITLWYVLHTRRIADATVDSAGAANRAADEAKRSTDIAAEVLKEMERQRFDASQPLVIADVRQTRYQGNRADGTLPRIVQVDLRNMGNGPALMVQARLEIGGVRYVGIEAGFGVPAMVAQGDPRAALEGRFELPALRWQQSAGQVEMTVTTEYRDVYDTSFVAQQTFDLDAAPGSPTGGEPVMTNLTVAYHRGSGDGQSEHPT